MVIGATTIDPVFFRGEDYSRSMDWVDREGRGFVAVEMWKDGHGNVKFFGIDGKVRKEVLIESK